MAEEKKEFSLLIKHVDNNLQIYSNNIGFTYYELMGILHDYITNDVLSKSEKLNPKPKIMN